MLKVVDIECIRKLYFREGWSIRRICKELHHSRKTIRKALDDAGPWEYRLTQPRPAPKVGPFLDLIRQWLQEDQRAPRKQRHTARRIYQRLRDEHGYKGAESTIRRTVALLRQELGTVPVEPYFILTSEPGEMAQVDWGQAKVELAGVLTTVHLFCLRLHYSGVSFVWASLHEKLEAFLEGHMRAFAWLEGVVEKVVYDNLSPVVRKVLHGHEKRELCERERQRRHERWTEEHKALQAVPSGTFKPCVIHWLPVNKLSLVTYECNRYSVPTYCIGQMVRSEVYADRLELYYRGNLVAVHRHATGRGHTELHLDHFLAALSRKPYAVTHAAVVRQLPEPYQTLRRHLLEADPSGYREMVQVLLLHREYSPESVREAVQEAITAGIYRVEGIRQLLINRHDRCEATSSVPPRGPEVMVGDPRRYDSLLGVSA